MGADDALRQQLNDASSGLNRFWVDHREFLNNIRNALAAHREHDALTYIDQLESVKPLEVMKLAAEFSGHLERLIRVLTELASLTVGIPAILRDMKRSANSNAEVTKRPTPSV